VIDSTSLPKAELHLHIEGTLEPELMFELARRNDIALPYPDVESVKRAYVFSDLQSFLDIYYQSCAVLVHEADFFDLTMAYLRRAHSQGVRHAEIFFDPQTHTERGVSMGTVVEGIQRALTQAAQELAITSELILCFLRHLPQSEAMSTLDAAMPYREHITGVGLDSGEAGNPPEKFKDVYDRARAEGLRTVAHAGEEGPPEYIWQALDVLRVERIDHGVRCVEDDRLMDRLAAERVPLTVCPLSNVRLRVVDTIADHPLPQLLARGLCATVNSDDPAYFGGYVGDNFAAVQTGLQLSDDDIVQLARNSFEASFLDEATKAEYQADLSGFESGQAAV
jgi:adenosine deaminase